MILSYLKRIVKFSSKIALATAIVTSIVTVTAIVLVGVFVITLAVLGSRTEKSNITRDVIYGKEEAKHQFVSIPITGMIVGDSSDMGEPLGLLSEMVTYGYDIKKTLRDLSSDASVDGVILDINSPGGTIYGANAIAEGVAYYKQKSRKPVVAFVSGLAASGAYWSAVSADMIIADLGTSVGSIGVISGPFQYYDTVIAQDGGAFTGGVVTQKGIETIFITAGKSKDFGNPYRKLTDEEINKLQSMVNNEYATFVGYVSQQRNIPSETIVSDLGAFLYDGKTAVEKKLIDKIGSREEAYGELASRANITDDDYSVSEEHQKKGLLMSILDVKSILQPMQAKTSFCGLTQIHLAYHGNVAALCE